MELDPKVYNANNVTKAIIAINDFRKSGARSLESKESYLAWVKDYKALIGTLEPVIRRIKYLRDPANVIGSPEFEAYQTAFHDTSVFEFCSRMQSRREQLRVWMNMLYDEREHLKSESYKLVARNLIFS